MFADKPPQASFTPESRTKLIAIVQEFRKPKG